MSDPFFNMVRCLEKELTEQGWEATVSTRNNDNRWQPVQRDGSFIVLPERKNLEIVIHLENILPEYKISVFQSKEMISKHLSKALGYHRRFWDFVNFSLKGEVEIHIGDNSSHEEMEVFLPFGSDTTPEKVICAYLDSDMEKPVFYTPLSQEEVANAFLRWGWKVV